MATVSPQNKTGRMGARRPPRSRYRQVETDDDNQQQEDGILEAGTLDHTSDPSVPLAVEVPSEDNVEASIQIKTVDDVVYRIPYRPGLVLGELRAEILRVANIQPNSQKLIFNGRILSDDASSVAFIQPGSCVHLVIVQPGQNEGRARVESHSSNDSDVNPYGVHGMMPETLVQRQMSHLHGLAWVVVVVFALFTWRMLMTLAFDDDPEHSPFGVNLGRFILAVFGLAVGWYGVTLVSGHRNSTFIETKKRVFRYIMLLTLLSMGYLLSTLEAVNFDKDAFFGVFLIQSTFWYCILQAQMTHRALAVAVGSSSSAAPAITQQPAPAAAPLTTPRETQPTSAATSSHWAFQAPSLGQVASDGSTTTSSNGGGGSSGRTWTVSALSRNDGGDVEMQALPVQPVALVTASPVVPQVSAASANAQSSSASSHQNIKGDAV